MQTINGFLKTNGVTAIWCDKNGQTAETPSITVGMCCRFRIAIFRDEIDENGDLIPVSFEEMQGAEILEKYTNSALALDVYNGAGLTAGFRPRGRSLRRQCRCFLQPC